MLKAQIVFLSAAVVLNLTACGDDSSSGGGGGGGAGGGASGTGGDLATTTTTASAGTGSTTGSSTVAGTTSTAVGSTTSAGAGGGGTGGSGDGGDGSGTGGDGNGGFGSGPAGPGVGGGDACLSAMLFADSFTQACAEDACCDEMTLCANDEDLCFDQSGQLDATRPDGSALYECAYLAGCLGSGVCDSGLGFGLDPSPATLEYAYCLDRNCCEQYSDCAGSDPDACMDCLNEGTGALCEAALECEETYCP